MAGRAADRRSVLPIALGGAVGGVVRYRFGDQRIGLTPGFPWALLTIIACGLFLFGLCTGPDGALPGGRAVRDFLLFGVAGATTAIGSYAAVVVVGTPATTALIAMLVIPLVGAIAALAGRRVARTVRR